MCFMCMFVCVCVCVFSVHVCAVFDSFCVCATIKDAFPGSWRLCLAVVVPSFACCLATPKLIQTQIMSQERRPRLCLMPASPPSLASLPPSPSLKLQSPHKSPALCQDCHIALFWHSGFWAAYTQSAVVVCVSDHR